MMQMSKHINTYQYTMYIVNKS